MYDRIWQRNAKQFIYFPYFEQIEQAYEITLLCVYVCLCISPIVARRRLGKNPLIVARQRLG
jgi:hypothetical protein